LARRYYHDPLSRLGLSFREGGPFEQRRTERGRAQMIAAASALEPLENPPDGRPLEVTFLSGARHWYQTLFCIYSLASHAEARVEPIICDDGTLTHRTIEAILRVVPWARFELHDDVEARLDAVLPASRFPRLRARRIEYPHLRKLCDIHAGRQGWRLVLDSDMLFFGRPTLLIEWLERPDQPCHLIDPIRAYGYSPELLFELSGKDEPDRVNVGVCGLLSESIDWDRLEYWCGATLDREGPNYLQEQALTALLLSGQACLRLPEADYRVMPSVSEGNNPAAVLHHYVAHSKRSYFQYGWHRILADARNRIAA
jgi:hypothetical protein